MEVRKPLRLREFDYARPGGYFVTVCLSPRRPLLARVADTVVVMTPLGRIVSSTLESIPLHHPDVELDDSILMPDHVHAILLLGLGSDVSVRARHASPLPTVVGSFKSASARLVNRARGTPGAPLWQRGFYDHVIRDEDDLDRVRAYIRGNPARWKPHPRP